jgi:hypothetical protein
MEKIFWTSDFLLMSCGFIYPFTPKAKTAAFGQQLIRMRWIDHYMFRRLGYGAPYHEIGNRPHIL